MKITVSTKGQIVLPAEFREQDGIAPGETFVVERIEPGQYLLRRQPSMGRLGLVSWLRDCPADGWFQPLSSESTEELGCF